MKRESRCFKITTQIMTLKIQNFPILDFQILTGLAPHFFKRSYAYDHGIYPVSRYEQGRETWLGYGTGIGIRDPGTLEPKYGPGVPYSNPGIRIPGSRVPVPCVGAVSRLFNPVLYQSLVCITILNIYRDMIPGYGHLFPAFADRQHNN